MSKRCRLRDYVCRPPRDAQAQADSCVGDRIVYRLDPNGRWAPDDGRPGLAFAAGTMHYYPDVGCQCFGADTCVSRRSGSKVSSQFGSANGRPVRARKRKDT